MDSSINSGLEELRRAYQDFIDGFQILSRLWGDAVQRFPNELEKAKENPHKKISMRKAAVK